MTLSEHYDVPAQEWQFTPGERTVPIYVREPEAGVRASTGIMIVLHGWGGDYRSESMMAWIDFFPDAYDVIVVSVQYLQSTKKWWPGERKVPYDHGYLQAIDAIRALGFVRERLREAGAEYDDTRLLIMGASGGGNITQMAAKFAPRTFAVAVDCCGMPGLTDAIAYGTGEGTTLNAAYSRDPQSPSYLAPHAQRIRDFGDPQHCRIAADLAEDLKIVIIHGLEDAVCPAVPKIRQFANMVEAGLDVDAHFLGEADVDGESVTAPDHGIGPMHLATDRYAGMYLRPDGPLARRLSGPPDLDRGEQIAYPVEGGRYVIDYRDEATVRFEGE
jgi:predicted esterase